MVKHNNSSRYNDKGKCKHHDTRANPNKKPKVTCWKCGKLEHLKRIKRLDDDIAWWVDSEAIVHVCKDRCPKTSDEAMKSQDVSFWKEAINDEIDSIIGNNTWVLTDLPPGCRPLGCKWIFKRKLKMDVKTAFLNGELEEEVYMNQSLGFIMPGNENKCWKVKLMQVGSATLKTIRLPVAGYFCLVVVATTLEKAYSQMYNGKSRHLGVRHNMIRELITNGVVSIEFVRSQQNLGDHLTKGLARDLVIKSAEGMELKSN
nr:zinc finger, CCHC-type [Tanacetum cinerariifolium]